MTLTWRDISARRARGPAGRSPPNFIRARVLPAGCGGQITTKYHMTAAPETLPRPGPPGRRSRARTAPGAFRGSEQNDSGQILGDVGEPVGLPRGHVDDRPRADRGAVLARPEHRPPGGDHVDLVLGVRHLLVGAAAPDRVAADAQVGGAQVLDPVTARLAGRRGWVGRGCEEASAGQYLHPAPGPASAKASGGGQAQTRFLSPKAWSIRRTGGQYLARRSPGSGKAACSRS